MHAVRKEGCLLRSQALVLLSTPSGTSSSPTHSTDDSYGETIRKTHFRTDSGRVSASANMTVKQNAIDHATNYPLAANALIDDGLSLKLWNCNSSEQRVIQDLPTELRDTPIWESSGTLARITSSWLHPHSNQKDGFPIKVKILMQPRCLDPMDYHSCRRNTSLLRQEVPTSLPTAPWILRCIYLRTYLKMLKPPW